MTALYTSLMLIIAFMGLSSCEFPNDPKPCKYGDTECVQKQLNYYMGEKNLGDSSVNLIQIDPLQVAKIEIKQGSDSPVAIDLNFFNTDLYGFKGAKVYKVKGFGKELTDKHEIHMKLPIATLLGDYSISGKVLILPIQGTGKSNITMKNLDFGFYFKGTPYEKDGETYLKIEKLNLVLEPERMYYHFENLFNGDKALGDNMNLFLNENWKEIFGEVRVTITAALAKIFETVMNNAFTKYPYNKFLTE